MFQSALAENGALVAFDSGGVQVNVTGTTRPALTLINQTSTADNRTAYVIAGKGGSTGYKWGVDIPAADTQNWGIYDVAASAYRVYIDVNGKVGIGGSAPNQQLEVTLSQNADTLIQAANTNTGTSARAGFIAAAYDTIYLRALAYNTGYTTYGGHVAILGGTGSRLYLGANNLNKHYVDTTTAGTLVLNAADTTGASVRLAHGAAPTSPVDGDMWTTTSGLFVRINGSTVGPLA